MESGSREKRDLSSSRNPLLFPPRRIRVSTQELFRHYLVREHLRSRAKAIFEREVKIPKGFQQIEKMIDEEAHAFSTRLFRDIKLPLSLSEQGAVALETNYIELEALYFCDQICEQMQKLLRCVSPTEEVNQQHESTISVAEAITRICADYVTPDTEFEEGTTGLAPSEEGGEGTAGLAAPSEEATAGLADVEGEAAVGRGNTEAGMGGDKIPTETDEAPWVDIYHKGMSVTEMEEEEFAAYRRCWERQWGNVHGNSFENLSLISPMMFTQCTPGCSSIGAVVGRTFQVYSVKIAELKGLQWPLKVYGVVAARDDVDKHRNPLFLRSRDEYQVLHQEDPFLQLTGPCRAIVSEEPIEIEIQLRVNRGKKSDDRPLISDIFYYNGDNSHLFGSSTDIENHLCKVELEYQQFSQSVQATFLGFCVGEPSPFECGVRVVCSAGSIEDGTEPKHRQIVLFDSRYRSMPMGKCGYLSLSRQVVSVELQGGLEVLVQAYAPSGDIAAHESVFITPQECNTSQHSCNIGDSELKFTVAWSLLADKTLMLMNGYVDPFEDLPPYDPSLLDMLGISE